jgi:hypothetical protein
MAELHHALTALARRDPDLAWRSGTAKQIDALLGEAKARNGMVDRADRVLYALQAVRFHSFIHRHPLLQQRLSQIAANGPSYAELCSDLDDARLRHLVNELDLHTANRP